MGGHGHGHEPPIKMPDWRNYKLENCPPLLNVQKALAQRGLKDPWIRNHIWKYPPEVSNNLAIRFGSNLISGVRTGFIMCVGILSVEYAYKYFNPPKDHHGHHH